MGKPRGVYTRRGGGDLTEEEETAITKLISQRYAAKKQRNFDVADELRDDLYNDYNVKIDDRSNEWRLDTNDYAMNGANTLNEDQVALIDVKLKQRFQLKKEGGATRISAYPANQIWTVFRPHLLKITSP